MSIRARLALLAGASILLTYVVPNSAVAADGSGEVTSAQVLLDELRAEEPSTQKYERALFAEGLDDDGNGCRTRQEVLIEESREPVVRGSTCTILSGLWYSAYDGLTHTDPSALEIDHLVALKEAWISGAYAWTPEQRAAYANDLSYAGTLAAVTGTINNTKSDKDPSSWMPPHLASICEYVSQWIGVKWRWNLSVDAAERSALTSGLRACTTDATLVVALAPTAGRPTAAVKPEPDAMPVYRFWSPIYQGHFFTADAAERDAIIKRWPRIWTYEGQRYTAFATQASGTVPLYRFWSNKLNGHFYTADAAERDAVIKRWSDTWSYEGVAYYVYPATSNAPNTVPVARFWGPRVQHHFYTASPTERAGVIRNWSSTWTYEGDNFRVPAAGIPADAPPPAPPVTPAPPSVPGPTKPGNPGDIKNCPDFRSYAEAKAWFDTYYPHYGDIAKLDGDRDGIPCEGLPGAP